MELRTLLTEDRAVSPVIGVILMVAITVILAAVIGTFVLGLGQNVQSTPSASFDFDFDSSNTTNGNGAVTVTHNGGDTLTQDNSNAVSVNTTRSGNASSYAWLAADSRISAGDSANTLGYSNGGTIRVIWTGPNGESSATLGQQEAPA